MSPTLAGLLYLAAAVLFILGIKGLTHPRTAVRGNLMGATGMLMAIVVTLIDASIIDWIWIVVGLAIGGGIGAVLAIKVKMTGMPQMVALLNGFGGAASALVAGAELHRFGAITLPADASLAAFMGEQTLIAIAASGLIGAVTLTGSLLAFAKLQDLVSGNAIGHWGLKGANLGLTIVVIALSALFFTQPEQPWTYWAIVAVALVMGVTLVMPVGGADMPVVISLLNSYSGLAAAATGFVINNVVLIITGALVGASGIILTKIMCDAMNRSLANVLLGVMATSEKGPSADAVYAGRVKSASADEVAMLFDGARHVMIVPGYGMAVSQAQHAVRNLMKLLEARGTRVDFAIHPVAGRMPGHMNVLLAEADVPYDRLKEMDEANALMDQVDVVVVIGANDVVNPVARTDPTSPIAGMPIIEVDRARAVVVIKRSLSPGFAGIPNPLFAMDNCLMFFADGQKAVLDLAAAVEGIAPGPRVTAG